MPKSGHKRNPKKAASLFVIFKLSAAKQRKLKIIYELPLEENIFFSAATLRCSKPAATKQ